MQRSRLENLLSMFEKQKEDPFIIYALALEYQSIDEDNNAAFYFEMLLTSHGDYLPVYYQAGLFMVKKGEITRALELFKKGMLLAHSLNDKKTYNELREIHEQIEEDFL